MEKNNDHTQLNDAAKKRIEEAKENENLQARILQELKENEEIRKYLEPYDKSNRDSFLKSYAHHKFLWTRYEDLFQSQAEREALEHRPEAEACLAEIQQKKLFDLQCQWRAGEVKLEGIESTVDFLYWSYDIMSCPCIDPISQEEVDMYVQYLESGHRRPQAFLTGFQDYDTFKSEYQDEPEGRIPSWYEFHNNLTGNGTLLLLPDQKGEAELRYISVHRADMQIKNEKKNPTPNTSDGHVPKPKVSEPRIYTHNPEDLEAFVRKFENKAEYTRFLHYRNTQEKSELNETIEEELTILQESTEQIPIQAHSDWREAIRLAAMAYKDRKVARAMATVYDDYLFKQQAGISFGPEMEKDYRGWMADYKLNILKGRKLLNEPEDFNY